MSSSNLLNVRNLSQRTRDNHLMLEHEICFSDASIRTTAVCKIINLCNHLSLNSVTLCKSVQLFDVLLNYLNTECENSGECVFMNDTRLKKVIIDGDILEHKILSIVCSAIVLISCKLNELVYPYYEEISRITQKNREKQIEQIEVIIFSIVNTEIHVPTICNFLSEINNTSDKYLIETLLIKYAISCQNNILPSTLSQIINLITYLTMRMIDVKKNEKKTEKKSVITRKRNEIKGNGITTMLMSLGGCMLSINKLNTCDDVWKQFHSENDVPQQQILSLSKLFCTNFSRFCIIYKQLNINNILRNNKYDELRSVIVVVDEFAKFIDGVTSVDDDVTSVTELIDKLTLDVKPPMTNKVILTEVDYNLKESCKIGEGNYGRIYRIDNTDDKLEDETCSTLYSTSKDTNLTIIQDIVSSYNSNELCNVSNVHYNKTSIVVKKFMREYDERLSVDYVREVSIFNLMSLYDDDSYIPRMINTYIDNENVFIAMESYDSSLESLIVNNTQYDKFNVALQLCKAVYALHVNSVLHRDIKPANILYRVDSNNELKIVLTDFSLSKIYTPKYQGSLTPVVVTLQYRAMELLLDCPIQSFAVDIWSIGCIISEMHTGQILFDKHTEFEVILEILRIMRHIPYWKDIEQSFMYQNCIKNYRFYKNNDNVESEGDEGDDTHIRSLSSFYNIQDNVLIDLIKQTLTYDPVDRPTIIDVLAHPYFQQS